LFNQPGKKEQPKHGHLRETNKRSDRTIKGTPRENPFLQDPRLVSLTLSISVLFIFSSCGFVFWLLTPEQLRWPPSLNKILETEKPQTNKRNNQTVKRASKKNPFLNDARFIFLISFLNFLTSLCFLRLNTTHT
jgi:hypothetical protein